MKFSEMSDFPLFYHGFSKRQILGKISIPQIEKKIISKI